MVEGDEGVGLAAPEGGLYLDDRLPRPLARKAGEDRPQQVDQPPRRVGLAEEGRPVAVLQRAAVGHHIGEVGGEDRLVKTAPTDVGMRDDHFTPRFHRSLLQNNRPWAW